VKTPLSLKARALALLAQREHSASELRRKLLRHARVVGSADTDSDRDGDADAASRVDDVMSWLRARAYLSEERFIESRVNARVARYGNLRIRQELARHGLSVGSELDRSLKDTELDRAAEVWQRKFGTPPGDAAERARQARFLANRGFSAEVIARMLRRAGRVIDDD